MLGIRKRRTKERQRNTELSLLNSTQTQSMLVRTLFAWPYGGSQVFLFASFASWTQPYPLALIDGTFQAVLDLPPGNYKYKFLVDGIWRIDYQQPLVTDESGTTNNVIFVKPGLIYPILHSRDFRPSIDVDNYGGFHHSVSLLGGMHHRSLMQLSDSDVDVSRHRLSMHLSKFTAYELLPESGKITVLDVKLPVKIAFHIMCSLGLAVVPLWDDCNKQLSGMLTASDLISLLTELYKNGLPLTSEKLGMHTISTWKNGKIQPHRESVGATQPLSRCPLIHVGPHESLKAVALKILQNKISTVPIILSTQDECSPQLLHLACLSGILKHICRHFRHCPELVPLLQLPVGELPVGTWAGASGGQLTTLRPSHLLSFALNLLLKEQISSIPILDDTGTLTDVYCRSDTTKVVKDSAFAGIRLDQMSIYQALQVIHQEGGFAHNKRCQTCLGSDSLYEVMERLSDPVVRRLIVIEAGSRRVEGIITLRDVFTYILG